MLKEGLTGEENSGPQPLMQLHFRPGKYEMEG